MTYGKNCQSQENNYGKTPLHIASENKSKFTEIKIVEILLGNSTTNPNIQDNSGSTPLHLACNKNNIEVVKLLLDNPKTNPNIQDNDGYTPLHLACMFNRTEIVKILLNHPKKNLKPNPNIQNNDGDTPLHLACYNNNIEVVKLLLRFGVNTKIQNNSHKVPFAYIKNDAIKLIFWTYYSKKASQNITA